MGTRQEVTLTLSGLKVRTTMMQITHTEIVQFARNVHCVLALKAYRNAHLEDWPKGTTPPGWLCGLTALYFASAPRTGLYGKHPAADILKLCLEDEGVRLELDSVARLGGLRGVRAWVRERTRPRKLTKEEREQARLAGIAKKAQRAEAAARANLARHQRALRREQAAVKKWAARVRYYDRRKAVE